MALKSVGLYQPMRHGPALPVSVLEQFPTRSCRVRGLLSSCLGLPSLRLPLVHSRILRTVTPCPPSSTQHPWSPPLRLHRTDSGSPLDSTRVSVWKVRVFLRDGSLGRLVEGDDYEVSDKDLGRHSDPQIFHDITVEVIRRSSD